MQKNTAGQKIGAQMVNASDGSAFTGAVTVAVTGDAGTQATGSVGSGACTHEGNGYHTYAPAQAETNYSLIAFTFTGTGAVPCTIQVFTWGYDTTAAVVPSDLTKWNGTAVATPDTAGYPKVTIKDGTGTGEIDTASGKVSIVSADITSIQSGLATASSISTVLSAVAGVQADTDDIQLAIAALPSAPSANAVADAILIRNISAIEASAPKTSLAAAIMASVCRVFDDGAGNLIIYRTDGTTEHYRRSVITDSSLNPISTLGGAA